MITKQELKEEVDRLFNENEVLKERNESLRGQVSRYRSRLSIACDLASLAAEEHMSKVAKRAFFDITAPVRFGLG